MANIGDGLRIVTEPRGQRILEQTIISDGVPSRVCDDASMDGEMKKCRKTLDYWKELVIRKLLKLGSLNG